MEQYLIYLRKSRSDLEAEAHGEGETLSRHEHTLLELAKRQHLNVTDIYREVVSGDTIAARPMMQRVLSEVEQGVWSGVLVMEVERLARGDTIDQGIIAQTFKFSGTKIITPIKTYDPDNEFDEEYFEFGLFMSRREYKIINRRLQRGRLASAKRGQMAVRSSSLWISSGKAQKRKGLLTRAHRGAGRNSPYDFRPVHGRFAGRGWFRSPAVSGFNRHEAQRYAHPVSVRFAMGKNHHSRNHQESDVHRHGALGQP